MSTMDSEADELVEGVGNEVLVGIATIIVTAATLFYFISRCHNNRSGQAIHPESRSVVDDTLVQLREQRRSDDATASAIETNSTLRNGGDMFRLRRGGDDNQCPICLAAARYAIETNCGHFFCGTCIVMYWRHGTWLGAVRCPVCRQQVTLLLRCFTDDELNSAETDDVDEKDVVTRASNDYNRRFSGVPRPLMDYVRDLPTLLRHLWNEFFSVGGLMYMFRIRIILCFFAACMYLISPLDIIPEAIFGILGLLDDVFVVLLLAVYVSIIYRRFLASRAAEQLS